MKRLAKILWGTAALVVALSVTAVAILVSLDFNEYRGMIAERAKAATGREVTISGDLKLALSLSPSLAVSNVTLANAPWGSRPEMARLDRLDAVVEVLPLLRREVHIKRLELSGLDLLLETDARGRGNWEFGAAAAPTQPEEADAGVVPVISDVRVEKVRVTFRDGKTGQATRFSLDRLKIGADGLDAPIRFELKAAYEAAPIEAKGELGPARALMEGGRPFPVHVTGAALGVGFALAGEVADVRTGKGLAIAASAKGDAVEKSIAAAGAVVPALKDLKLPPIGPFDAALHVTGDAGGRLAGKNIRYSVGRPELVRVTGRGDIGDLAAARGIALDVAVEVGDMRPFAPLAGGELPKLPPFKLTAKVSDAGGGYRLDGLEAKVGESDLSGSLWVRLEGARPRVEGDLGSALLDLDSLLPAEKAAKKPAKADDGRIFPDDPLPLDALRTVDAKVRFKGRRVVARGFSMTDVDVGIGLDGGRLRLAPLKAVVAGGRIDGDIHLNSGPGSPQPDLTVKLAVVEFDLKRALADAGVKDLITGKLDANVDVRGRGRSVRALMAGLDGKVRAVSKGGRIDSAALDLLSADVLSALPGFDSKADKQIRCAVLDYDVRQGQASSRATVLETGGLSIVGEGGINLATETIDMRVDPRAKNVSLARVAAVPLNVGGKLGAPVVTPDPLGTLGAVAGVASGAAAVATGGLSILGGLALGNRVRQPDQTDYCALALTGRPLVPGEKAATPPEQTPSASPEQQQEDKGIGGAIKGLGDGISKGIKGLFGR